MTAAAVIARYRRYGWSAPEGEWGWIQSHTRQYFREALEAGDEAAVWAMLRSMFRGPLCMGLVSYDYREKAELGRVLKYMDANLQVWGGDDLEILRAPNVGAPAYFDVAGVPILFDTPRHDHYAQRILELGPQTVLEIGGGYGGTALQILRRSPGTRIILVDLPETLYIAWYWLAHSGVDVAWFDDYALHPQVYLLPADLVSLARADVVFATHSLSEMPPETCQQYMAWITNMGPRYFYHDAAVRPPVDDGHCHLASVYPETPPIAPDGYHELGHQQVNWPMTGDRYCEFLYGHD